jgi:hypothetical protein
MAAPRDKAAVVEAHLEKRIPVRDRKSGGQNLMDPNQPRNLV